jgi:hypothetical protein
MIKFRCLCSALIEVGDDFAGMSLQCPKCRRLVDVPTLSDLPSLSEDGSFKIDELKLRNEADRLSDLQRVYAPGRVDEHGNEKDLREQFHQDDSPIEMADDDVLEVINEEPVAPKYDPVTGELVRAVELRNEPVKFDPNSIPMAKAVINYAQGDDTREFSGWRIIPAMFRYENLFVILIILFVHVFLQLMMAPVAAGMLIVLPGLIVLIAALLGHYANVIEDIGFEGKDELPRPLRDASLYDDIWRPFINMCLAIMVCYGPAVFYHRFPPMYAVAYLGTVLIVGTIGFPAVLLTTTSSGTVINLAPHKLLRVITASGVKYLFAVILWVATAVVYLVGMIGILWPLAKLLTSLTGSVSNILLPLVFAYPVLMLGIAMAHGLCWYLGLIYRAHHDQFDWYLQQHQRRGEMIRSPSGVLVPAPNKPIAPRKPPSIPPKGKAIPAPAAPTPVKPIAAPTPVQPLPPRPTKRYPQSHA